jgi:signal transduction histidine kinase
VLLAFLPVFLLTLYEGLEQRRHALVRAQESALSVARVAAGDQGRMIEGIRQLLLAISRFPAVRDHDAAACSSLVADLQRQNPLYSQLGAAWPNGDVFCGATGVTQGLNCGDRPFFQEVLRTRDFVVGDYIIMRGSGKPGIAAVFPALDETGEVLAVVFAGIDLTWLDGFVAAAQLPEGSTLTLVDGTGTIVTRYPEPERWRGQQLSASLWEPIMAQGEGVADQVGMDGVRRLYAFTKFCCPESGDLFLRIGIPRSVALADANRMLIRNLIMLGLVTLLALGVAWGGARVLVLKPVQALLGAIKRYDAGDFGARTGLEVDGGELSSVGSALDSMAATVEARQQERDRSVEALRRESARSEAMALIAGRLNAQVDLEGVLNTVCQETARALSVQAASVSLCGVDQGCMHLATCWGLPQDFCERVHASAPAAFAPIQEGRPVSVADVGSQLEQSDAALFSELDIRSFVGAPMLHEGQLVGALFVFSQGEQRLFSDDEIEFLKAISDQAATAVANARLYGSLKREQQLSARLLRGTITAQEDERKRIARELHDETIQGLIGLILSLDTIGLESETCGQEACPPLRSARSAAQGILEGIRRLIADLRPSLLDDLGLIPAIAWYAERLLEPLGIAVDVSCNLEDVRLLSVAETALFRVAQEAINNIAKHSGSTQVHIGLWISDGTAVLSVQDNGHGFEVDLEVSGGEQKGLGLQGIRERVAMLGGEFSLESSPGQGTALEVRVPLILEDNGNGQDPAVVG